MMIKEGGMKARTLIGLALLFAVGAVFGFQSAQDVFQQALSKERSEGNLKEAIVLYQKTIDLSKDEALSAKAQLQIGLCYEKLGLQEAEKAFRLVIEKYPGQAEAVKQAREKLAQFSALAGPPAQATGLSLRKLDIPAGIVSPDGKYLASLEGESNPYIFNIADQKKIIIRNSAGNLDFQLTNPLWATDASKLAYVWSTSQEIESLNVWDLATGSTKKIFEDPNMTILNLSGWSTDHADIYLRYRLKDGIERLGRFSQSNGSLKEVLVDKNIGLNASLSPDGRFLAYNYWENGQTQEIRTLEAGGNSQSTLFKFQGEGHFIGWTPDANAVLFTSNRSGTNGLWLQGVRNGKAENEPRLLGPVDGEIHYSGITNIGALYYETGKSVNDVYVAKIDLETRNLQQTRRKVEAATIGRTSTPFWSADGRQMAYFFRKGVSANDRIYDTLRIVDQETGSTREISLDFAAQPGSMQLPRWTLDGKYVHLLSLKNGRHGLLRFDVTNGRSEMLSDEKGINAWSTDGRIIYLISRGTPGAKLTESQNAIIRKDRETGKQKVIYQAEPGEVLTWLKLSPDESLLVFHFFQMKEQAFARQGTVIIPADAETALSKNSAFRILPYTGSYNWHPNSKGLFIQVLPKPDEKEKSSKPHFLYYPTLDQSLNPIKLEIDLGKMSPNIAFHPDGKTIAFTGSSHISEFWVMENFLPKK